MRALLQRVTEARVRVDGAVVGEIGPGLCVLVGVTHGDDQASARRLADKVWRLRIFDDADGVMNIGLHDAGGAALVVSQFTLYGDTRKGGARRGRMRRVPSTPSRWSTRSLPRCASSARPSRPGCSVPTWPSSS